MPERIGCGRITTASASSKDTGKAIAAAAGMTTIGIATIAAATSIAITTIIEVTRNAIVYEVRRMIFCAHHT
jgi:hypothetical protein